VSTEQLLAIEKEKVGREWEQGAFNMPRIARIAFPSMLCYIINRGKHRDPYSRTEKILKNILRFAGTTKNDKDSTSIIGYC
jgi:hypothetical protein